MAQKVLNSDEKRIIAMPKLLNSRLIITCIFSVIALTLYIAGFFNFPALCLIVAGALWNFFADINSCFAFILSLVVGLLYGMFAYMEGMYMNAILYTAFYIPMQFITWITNLDNKDMSIKNDKRLFKKGFVYEYVAMLLVLVCLAVLCYFNPFMTLSVLDAVTACLLGFSAMLQSYMFREYYYIRPFAVLSAILLWVAVILINGFSMICFVMIILYLMYLTNDLMTTSYWRFTVNVVEPEEVEEQGDNGSKTIEKEKIEEYKKLVEQENNKNSTDGGNVTA
ncbi:MAG: nicotinamide mononucleotide transporter [Clostridia bacterium]|nr:nicotinamide mononucleotide transporter [Clostridia bacterium]